MPWNWTSPRAARAVSPTFILAAFFLTTPASAQTESPADLLDLSVQQLLGVDVVSSVSKFEQPTTDAPASITIVTGQEVRRYGHRTLADVLRGVQGLYVTYDRNYSYLGIRGFARPGDYNTRVLLLIDGHRINDPLYDMAPIGTDFPVDIALIERIEVIRGPASALYGTSAFLGTINIVTRTGDTRRGVEAEASTGSLGTRTGRVTWGRSFGLNNVLLSASGLSSDGLKRAYFSEFDAPGTNNGVAVDRDGDDTESVFGSASIGRVSISAAHSHRIKKVPTAPFETVFNTATLTRDDRSYVSAAYAGRLGHGWTGTMRAAYDRYYYTGEYPTDYGGNIGQRVSVDESISDTVSGEVTASHSMSKRHFLTVGSEVRAILRANQRAGAGFGAELDDRRSDQAWAGYVQDDIVLVPMRLSLNIGIRADRADVLGVEATPRAGLIFRPTAATSVKLLHGGAYRAPNYYERYYNDVMRDLGLALAPERIRTDELIWEQTFGRHVRTSANVFRSRVSNLITSAVFENSGGNYDGALYFVNEGHTMVTGLSADLEARWASGASVRASHGRSRARDESGVGISNSPAWLGTVSGILPLVPRRLFVATEGQYVGPRRSVRGAEVDGYYVQNLTLSADRLARFDLSLSLRNLFNTSYSDPGADEHIQDAIPQDGRTTSLRVTFHF